MLTLIEMAKAHRADTHRSSIIELYAKGTDILRVLPFVPIEGNAYHYNQEAELPGIGFRGINEGYTSDVGVINPQTEHLVIAGGEVDVDKFLVKTGGPAVRAVREAMKVKALSHKWGHAFIKGDSETNPKEYDGLQKRLGGDQLIANGSSSGGDAVSLNKVDEVIDAVDGANFLLMSKAMRRIMTASARNTGVGGYVTTTQDEFGRELTRYRGLPILIADRNGDVYKTLGFNEANPGGGSNVGTSIYALNLNPGMLSGMQNGDIETSDLGEISEKPAFRTRVEWYAAILMEHARSAARLWGIKNAPAVA